MKRTMKHVVTLLFTLSSVSLAATTQADGTSNAPAADLANGAKVYAATCAQCHGPKGEGIMDAPTLVGETDLAKVKAQVENGGQQMPPMKQTLTEREIADVARFVLEKLGK
jgi:mono/diheme cytochrome c family protein